MNKIIVTCGDPNGIGVEIFHKCLNNGMSPDNLVFVGNEKILKHYANILNLKIPEIEVVNIQSEFSLNPGKIETINGQFSAKCIEKAVELIKDGYGKALVTLPICKENFRESGYNFEGHTDFLKHLTHSKRTMMMFYSPSFSVVLHTIHIPLKDVFEHINQEEIEEKIEFAYLEAKRTLKFKKPEIYVCGLNPHAGENGHIGDEDFEIKKGVEKLKEKGIPVKGVFPSDTLFSHLKENPEQIVYAMYHDQGLIGIKTKHPEKSVNITLGLPFLRLSVSHGTAFDIAGKGIADYNNLWYVLITANKLLGRG
ncbi:4-hydroxythreonine-4-phosphate dehydrogenase [Thermotomaculum hydrothermale]|uniref:4-hydroxythreonine-4-phosphate dehydrogenase n=1 Tax=Thermotomaculum hydrothermale TaxID=981385 RepID=A0A7R6PP85_9BACT|nr:4-hydroxythreonine-4-phosphate dehydrogenase PdxA [Thermotomaculum hydrothermale]BBB33308.1 4-hydroxythreonine-4-phosphate dehydrogenase [Thermotomaculum hydrothermale]